MPHRTPKLTIILGYNGTGKTTLAKKIVANEIKHNRRALIVTPDDIEWPSIEFIHEKFPERISDYVKARKVIYFEGSKDKKGLLQLIAENLKNSLLIFDDCRAYFGARTEADLHKILIRRRQYMVDIIAVGHGFTEVPPKLFTFASEIILFRTIDNIYNRRSVLRNFEQIEAAQTRINKIAETKPHYFEILKM